jgi:hypothetical protein
MWLSLYVQLFEVYQVFTNSKHIPIAWITKRPADTRWEMFYCDGKNKILKQRESLHDAQTLGQSLAKEFGHL